MTLLPSRFRRLLAVVLVAFSLTAAKAANDTAVLAFSSMGITGSFTVKLDRATQALVQVTGVSLKVNGHEYRKKDIEFTYDAQKNLNLIGAAPRGPEVVAVGSGPDFFLIWSPKQASGYFSYTDKGSTAAPFDLADIVLSIR